MTFIIATKLMFPLLRDELVEFLPTNCDVSSDYYSNCAVIRVDLDGHKLYEIETCRNKDCDSSTLSLRYFPLKGNWFDYIFEYLDTKEYLAPQWKDMTITAVRKHLFKVLEELFFFSRTVSPLSCIRRK